MNLDLLIAWMVDNAQRIGGLVKGVTAEQARWKPDPDTWSLLVELHWAYTGLLVGSHRVDYAGAW